MEATTLCTPTPDDYRAAQKAVSDALDEARRLGVVVTVERTPLLPLAMGNAECVIHLRPARREIS